MEFPPRMAPPHLFYGPPPPSPHPVVQRPYHPPQAPSRPRGFFPPPNPDPAFSSGMYSTMAPPTSYSAMAPRQGCINPPGGLEPVSRLPPFHEQPSLCGPVPGPVPVPSPRARDQPSHPPPFGIGAYSPRPLAFQPSLVPHRGPLLSISPVAGLPDTFPQNGLNTDNYGLMSPPDTNNIWSPVPPRQLGSTVVDRDDVFIAQWQKEVQYRRDGKLGQTERHMKVSV